MNRFQRDPDHKDSTGGTEEQGERRELAVVPIFRSNDLYAKLFPEITPVFEKGEEPTAKKVFEAIKQFPGKEVVLDDTCYKIIKSKSKVSLEDFPIELEIKEVPNMRGEVDLKVVGQLFKEKFDISLPTDIHQTIDRKIAKEMNSNFSIEQVKGLFEIAKQKNPNIKQVYILSDNITDHVVPFPKEEVIDLLKEQVQAELHVEPTIIPTITLEEIKEGDLIIADRHNHAIAFSDNKINELLPRQVSILPLESELFNNQQFLNEEIQGDILVKSLRKVFEKSDE